MPLRGSCVTLTFPTPAEGSLPLTGLTLKIMASEYWETYLEDIHPELLRVSSISTCSLIYRVLSPNPFSVAEPNLSLLDRCERDDIDWMNRLHRIFLLKDPLILGSLTGPSF